MKKKKNLFRQIKHSFQVKVLISILFSVIIICIVSNLVISGVLGFQLLKKKEAIEKEYISVIEAYMEDAQKNLNILALLADNNSSVQWVMKRAYMDSVETKKYALDAQESLQDSLNANPMSGYVKNLFLVNSSGMLISVVSQQSAVRSEQIFLSPLFEEREDSRTAVSRVTDSVIGADRILAYVYPLDAGQDAFMYIEVDTKYFKELLEPYQDSANVLIRSLGSNGDIWYSSQKFEAEYLRYGEKRYIADSVPFVPFDIEISTMLERNIYTADNLLVLYVFLAAAATVICVGFTVSRMISRRITGPLRQVSNHIGAMIDQDHLFTDETIEMGEDEIAEIGRAFNRLVRHINDLIFRQKVMYEQKQRLEMNALQAQINPHFLYNTLDSIRWMAIIQNAHNIEGTVMSLENLLRNMAKGTGDKITLREELSLAQDYVNLQQVRYMEIFDYICKIPDEYMDYTIVKMTMQPVIENAIFHGIEPTGTYGEIRVAVCSEGEDLFISIEDNGIGMDEAELRDILKKKPGKNSMSGIGISNVNERLKMTYGSKYGLIYEAKKGCFTRVIIHIPKERKGEEGANV